MKIDRQIHNEKKWMKDLGKGDIFMDDDTIYIAVTKDGDMFKYMPKDKEHIITAAKVEDGNLLSFFENRLVDYYPNAKVML